MVAASPLILAENLLCFLEDLYSSALEEAETERMHRILSTYKMSGINTKD